MPCDRLHHLRKLLFVLGWLRTPLYRTTLESTKEAKQDAYRCKMLQKLFAVMYDDAQRKESMKSLGMAAAAARRDARVAAEAAK